MADDYLLLALTGALQGVNQAVTPFLHAKYQNTLEMNRIKAQKEADLQEYIKKQPYEQATKAADTASEYATKSKYQTDVLEPSQIRIEKAKASETLPLLHSDGTPVLNADGTPVMVPRGTKPLPASKDQIPQSVKTQVAELDNLKDRFAALRELHQESSSTQQFVGQKLESGISHLPIVGGLASNASAYNRLKGEVALQAQHAFTGSSRLIGQAIKFDVGQIPPYGDPVDVSEKQWNFLNDSIDSLKNRLLSSSGTTSKITSDAGQLPTPSNGMTDAQAKKLKELGF